MRAWLVCMGVAVASLANAHPLGNNTVNRQAGLQLSHTAITLDYRVDIAEIPTLLATTDADSDEDGSTSTAEWARYARAYAERIRQGITLRANDAPLALHLDVSRASLEPGAAGLSTLRIVTRFSAPLQPKNTLKLTYQDQREADQPGWKEVYFRAASGLAVRASDVPGASLSRDLTVYPAGEIPDVLAAAVEISVIAPPQSVTADKPEANTPPAMRPVEPPVVTATPSTPQLAPPAITAPVRPPLTARPVQSVPVAQPAPPSAPHALPAWAFFRLGVHHIAIGWDHLMFLLGLILAQFSLRPWSLAQFSLRPWKRVQATPSSSPALPAPPSLRRLIGVVTAFTVAHSLTLGLAASGLVMLPGAWVEAAIALTIAYVGLMNLLGRTRHSTLLAFAFGLVHGFGFAGALAASMGSLRTQSNDWLLNLAAFNLGIEAFQIVLVIVCVPILAWIARRNWGDTVLRTLSFIVMSAGLAWFLSRI